MSTLNIHIIIQKIDKTSLNYIHLLPDLALGLTLSGSNHPCLEQIYMVRKMSELLRFDCIYIYNAKNIYILTNPQVKIQLHNSCILESKISVLR